MRPCHRNNHAYWPRDLGLHSAEGEVYDITDNIYECVLHNIEWLLFRCKWYKD